MALNNEPLNPVTREDIEAYRRDGAVVLRGVLNSEWMEELLQAARRIVIEKEDFGLLPSMPGRYMARTIPIFRRLVFESPMAQVCAQVQESKEMRFFFDEMFPKPPQSDAKTIWHVDRMGWPVTGKMVPSLWLPLLPIVKENCLEVVAGAHTQDVPYWLFSPNARQMIKPDDRVNHPDCEPLRNDGKTKFLTWDMEPGDLLVVHPWSLHYSGGNPTDDWRIAVVLRMFGDDIRWAPRPDCLNLAGVSFDEMVEGGKPAGSHFPLLWSEDGRRDTDVDYPRSFATTWPSDDMGAIGDYGGFKVYKGKEARGELSQQK
jgi:hypothetical protein